MNTLLIAIGNPWRRDDGVAAKVVELLGDSPRTRIIQALQPAPEMAEEIAAADRVIWIDADVAAGEVRLDTFSEAGTASVTHGVTAGEVVVLARRLYEFAGEALLCRIPVADLGEGEGLSPETAVACRRAVRLLRNLLEGT